MKFSREPAAYIALVGAVLTALAGHVPYVTAGVAAAVVALLTAAVTAYWTRPLAPALFVGVLNAAVALVGEYGLHLSGQVVTSLTAVLVFGLAVVGVRPQVTPVE